MPITIDAELRRLSQDEFGRIAFNVMGHAFDVHRELGRLFDESVYQTELAARCGNSRTGVRMEVSFEDFPKVYVLDLLVENGALFEIKTVESFHDRHRGQLLNYLLLADLAHGKLINFRTTSVQHEFVNTTLTRSDLKVFEVDDRRWADSSTSQGIKHRMAAMLRDLGAGLDLQLYKEAIIHWLGGPTIAICNVDVVLSGRRIGTHETVRSPDGAAIELTALSSKDLRLFEDHYRRLLNHVNLTALHWINISRSSVTFQTLLPNARK